MQVYISTSLRHTRVIFSRCHHSPSVTESVVGDSKAVCSCPTLATIGSLCYELLFGLCYIITSLLAKLCDGLLYANVL